MRSRNWSRVGSGRLVRSRCREAGRLEGRLDESRWYRGEVEEGVGRAEGMMVALLDARFRMEAGKSRGKCFDHVCDP